MISALRTTAVAAILVWSGLVLCAGHALGHPAKYFVNYDIGNDLSDGRSSQTAWRHAPGDPNASGEPALVRLRPGDTVLFAAGVHYRGQIKLNASGDAGQPIVLASAPGKGRAIIDGSDPVSNVSSCRSADDCGGSPLWSRLLRVRFPEALPQEFALFTEAGLLFPAQYPVPSSPFNSDAVSEYLSETSEDVRNGRLFLSAKLAHELAIPSAEVVLELYANEIAVRPLLGIADNVARFDPAALRFNTDRPARFAIVEDAHLIGRPGEYALLPGRTGAVIYPPPGAAQIFLALGRGGIDINSQSFVEVRGIDFEDMAGSGPDWKSGVAIIKNAPGSNIVIADDEFKYFVLPRGLGPVQINFTSSLSIVRNRFFEIQFGSAIRLYKDRNTDVSENVIDTIGRTGIMLIDISDGTIFGNLVRNARGIHGNGISAYIDNEGLAIERNTVYATLRPVTIGHGSPGVQNNLVLERNIFVGTPDSEYALTSWGDEHGVKIAQNVIVGGKAGVGLSESDSDIILENNLMNGALVVKHKIHMLPEDPNYVPAPWKIVGNRRATQSPPELDPCDSGIQVLHPAGGDADILVGSPIACVTKTGASPNAESK